VGFETPPFEIDYPRRIASYPEFGGSQIARLFKREDYYENYVHGAS
jgi:hypothetical protein